MWITVTFSFISCKVFLERQKDKPNSLESVKQGNGLVLQFSKNYHCFLLVTSMWFWFHLISPARLVTRLSLGNGNVFAFIWEAESARWETYRLLLVSTLPPPHPPHTPIMWESLSIWRSTQCLTSTMFGRFLKPESASLLSLCESTTDQPFQAVTLASGHPCLSCDVGFIRNVMVAAISIQHSQDEEDDV